MENSLTKTLHEAPEITASKEPSDGIGARLLRSAGWTFIWLGLFLVGFVIHQIYITTWFAQQEQAELNVERLEYFADVDVRTVIVDPQGNPIEDAETGEPILPDPLRLPSIPDPVDPSDSGPADPDDPLPAAAPSDERFSMVIEPEPSRGTAFAIVRVPVLPRLVDGWNVVEGVELRQLRKGAGHMPWTPLPGQRGNAVISGHRTTHGAPFHEFNDLEPGDRIEVETATGVHVYEVRLVKIVRPEALWVTNPDGPKRAGLAGGGAGAWLTLTTCHPIASARQRLIVFAQMVDGPNFATIDRLTG